MKYLFYIAKIYSIPIIRPLAAYLSEQGGEYRFYVSDAVYENKPREWNNELVLRKRKQAKDFNPDFVLCPGNFVDFRIPGIKVQLFHGLGVEKDVHYKIRHFFDIYCTSGPYVTERFKRLQQEHGYFSIIESGWPKVDYILNFPAQNVLEKYGLPVDKKIVLYAPTFSKEHESATNLLNTIPELMSNDEFWLFKFHELMDREVVKRFEALSGKNSRLIINEEITPYLHAADVMISDTSSVVYEFMLLDKPVITFRTQAREDKGINIKKASELRDALNRSFRNPQEFHEQRMRHLQEINPALDGRISERLFEKLEETVGKNLLPGKPKPFNLFRKMQIVYHGIFRKGYLR